MKKIIRVAVCGLLVFFAVWFSFNLRAYIRRVADGRESARQAEIIHGFFAGEESPVSAARFAMDNDEIIAHIHVPGTAINYAVAHGEDNEFYLYHDLLRLPNENGSIFMDYANSPCFTNRSTIIYGHNRSNGTKFHDLRLFQEREFFEENVSIIITTDEKVLQYEIFAVFTAHMSFNYIKVDFADDAAFLSLMHEIKDRATHTRDVSISADDKVLILSTCTAVGTTGRLAVAGKKILTTQK